MIEHEQFKVHRLSYTQDKPEVNKIMGLTEKKFPSQKINQTKPNHKCYSFHQLTSFKDCLRRRTWYPD